jgi:hypothetical protein
MLQAAELTDGLPFQTEAAELVDDSKELLERV